jgi:hypothetical protein
LTSAFWPLLLDVLRHAGSGGILCSNSTGGLRILAQARKQLGAPSLHAAAALPLQLRCGSVLRTRIEANLEKKEGRVEQNTILNKNIAAP